MHTEAHFCVSKSRASDEEAVVRFWICIVNVIAI